MEKTKSLVHYEVMPEEEVSSLKIIEVNEKQQMKIEKFYQHLLKSNFPFDALSWALAELKLIFEKGSKKYSEREVIEEAEHIFDSDLNYDTLCWLISRYKIYLEEIELYP